MLCFPLYQHHPQFLQELEEFIEKHCPGRTSVEQTLSAIQNLLTSHFYLKDTKFTNKHLGRATNFDGYEVYWFHMIIPGSGLSRTQFPKSYFYKFPQGISFLCLDSHLDNYDDSKLRKLAKNRLIEMIDVLNKC